MKIREVVVTSHNLDAAATFYRDVLKMPVEKEPARVLVTIGRSRLVIARGEQFDGVHHLAFGISPHAFDHAHAWLKSRVALIRAGGDDVIIGPAGWDSESVYFLGPDDTLLEFIARQADAGVPAADGDVPRPVSISEIGISVPDTSAAVGVVTAATGLPTFPPQERDFAPVGDHDGLLIIVDQDRVWFPTQVLHPAHGSLTVRIETPDQLADIVITEKVTISTAPADSRTR
ncbi:VOC family protein [Kribbella capetownensis]|uniref:VOC family protein n=1 Tax=Kribbella capetownensis TaxID=1572659 RepID=A0A4R0IW22_9ACTN|nr:VOC family protein [Kribbella capetownensis]TCC37407.1 VOC family protein [Kribbella capetownensis]